jgi:Zn-finger nucleic acid-binding protein
MKCPIDSATLVMSERAGVEIDYCPECRGVWLDRGELDKIVERAEAELAALAAAPPARPAPEPESRRSQYTEPGYASPRYDDRSYSSRPRKKKEHWLSELFD